MSVVSEEVVATDVAMADSEMVLLLQALEEPTALDPCLWSGNSCDSNSSCKSNASST